MRRQGKRRSAGHANLYVAQGLRSYPLIEREAQARGSSSIVYILVAGAGVVHAVTNIINVVPAILKSN